MSKGEKFQKLAAYLESMSEDVISMSFKVVEEVLGFELAASAYVHSEYWANDITHSIANAWLSVGYKSVNVDMNNKTVEFVKD